MAQKGVEYLTQPDGGGGGGAACGEAGGQLLGRSWTLVICIIFVIYQILISWIPVISWTLISLFFLHVGLLLFDANDCVSVSAH